MLLYKYGNGMPHGNEAEIFTALFTNHRNNGIVPVCNSFACVLQGLGGRYTH